MANKHLTPEEIEKLKEKNTHWVRTDNIIATCYQILAEKIRKAKELEREDK